VPGAGSIYRQASGEFIGTIHDGDAAGLAGAKVALASGGLMQIGPGLEGLALGAGWGNICLARITDDGIMALSRFHMADGADPTKLLFWDASAITAATIRTATLPDYSGFVLLPANLGSSGQFLKSNGAGVQPSWSAVSITNALLDGANHTDTLAKAVLRGALIVGNSTPKWDLLPIGIGFLKGDGIDASWGRERLLTSFTLDTTPSVPVRGSLIVADIGANWTQFPRGATDTFLGMVGSDPQWRTAAAVAALLEHNALFHLKPFTATTVSMGAGSNQLVTTGGQFANVRIGDRANLDNAHYPPSTYGMRVTGLIDSNNVTMDLTNTGGAQSGATATIFPGDHFDHNLMAGLLSSGGYGTFDEGSNPGGTIPQVYGSFECIGYAGSGSQKWGFEGATTVSNPNGFYWKKRGSSARMFVHVQDITADRYARFPNLSGIVVLAAGAQNITDKFFIGGNEFQMDDIVGNLTGGHFADVNNPAKKLYFNLTGLTGAGKVVTWQDRSGTVALLDDPPIGSYAPGSFTLADGQYLVMLDRLSLTGSQAADLRGDAQLAILN
jgi:hypothetical protein